MTDDMSRFPLDAVMDDPTDGTEPDYRSLWIRSNEEKLEMLETLLNVAPRVSRAAIVNILATYTDNFSVTEHFAELVTEARYFAERVIGDGALGGPFLKIGYTGPTFDVHHIVCRQAAPISTNGSNYAGCSLTPGHDGPHRLTIEWGYT